MKIGFMGDFALCQYTANAKPEHIVDVCLEDFIKYNNHNIINMEGAITQAELTKPGIKQQNISTCCQFLRRYNIDICDLANNHLSDCGMQGIIDTISNLNKWNIDYIGAGLTYESANKYILLKEGDFCVGIIAFSHRSGIIADLNNVSPGIICDDAVDSEQLIREVKSKAHVCIVIYHGGDEFIGHPSKETIEKYHKFVDQGADFVVGHHPHVIQGYEKYKNKYIVYSIGNFYFDTAFQRKHKRTDVGLVINVDITKNRTEFNVMCVKLNREKSRLEGTSDVVGFSEIDMDMVCELYEKEVYFAVKNSVVGMKNILKTPLRFIFNKNARNRMIMAIKYKGKHL